MRTFAVVNHKGGAGKTTSAVHLAWGLAEEGHRTLLVDLDPQGAVGVYFGLSPRHTLYHAVLGGHTPGECVTAVRPGLDAMLGDGTLAQLELSLADQPRRERALRDALAGLEGYDAVVLDCPPSLSLIIVNAFFAADELIAPVQMELLSFRGLIQTLEYAQFMGRYLGYQPDFLGVVPTMVREDSPFHQRWLERTRRSMPSGKVLAPVPFDSAVPEGLQTGRTAFEVSAESPAAASYWQLVGRVADTLAGKGAQAATAAP